MSVDVMCCCFVCLSFSTSSSERFIRTRYEEYSLRDGSDVNSDVLLSCDDVFENILYGRLVEDQYMKEERRSILLFGPSRVVFSFVCGRRQIFFFYVVWLVFFYHSIQRSMKNAIF